MVPSIQYLRGVTAAIVVIAHACGYIPFERTTYDAVMNNARIAVDIFFVVSGFIMWLTTVKEPPAPSVFFWGRITRVVPLYWLVTLAMFPVLALSSTAQNGREGTVPELVASLFFFPMGAPHEFEKWPIYFPGWTVNFEMLFYSIFALCLFVGGRLARAAVLLLVLGSLVLIGRYLDTSGRIEWLFAPVLLEFAAGVVIAEIYCRQIPIPKLVAAGALAAAAGLFLVIPFPPVEDIVEMRVAVFGPIAALLVFGLVFLERQFVTTPVKWLVFLGDASYGLYLTHIFSLTAVAIVWHKLDLWPAGKELFLITAIAAAIMVGCLTHLRVEKPLLRLARKKWRLPALAHAPSGQVPFSLGGLLAGLRRGAPQRTS